MAAVHCSALGPCTFLIRSFDLDMTSASGWSLICSKYRPNPCDSTMIISSLFVGVNFLSLRPSVSSSESVRPTRTMSPCTNDFLFRSTFLTSSLSRCSYAARQSSAYLRALLCAVAIASRCWRDPGSAHPMLSLICWSDHVSCSTGRMPCITSLGVTPIDPFDY